jgi:hypothetical protein
MDHRAYPPLQRGGVQRQGHQLCLTLVRLRMPAVSTSTSFSPLSSVRGVSTASRVVPDMSHTAPAPRDSGQGGGQGCWECGRPWAGVRLMGRGQAEGQGSG